MAQEKKSFFVTGVGTGYQYGSEGNLKLLTLQNMTIELTTDSEDIFGGEGFYSLYNYITNKAAKYTFTEASMSLDMIRATQGSELDENPVLFDVENLTVGEGGLVVPTNTNLDMESLLVLHNDEPIEFTVSGQDITVDAKLAGKKVEISYRYSSKENVQGTSVLTTSVPGYVELRHRSNPIKQKDGSTIIIYTTIFKARCDGTLKIDYQQKGAFSPELAFTAVDPEREDKKFVSFAIKRIPAGK